MATSFSLATRLSGLDSPALRTMVCRAIYVTQHRCGQGGARRSPSTHEREFVRAMRFFCQSHPAKRGNRHAWKNRTVGNLAQSSVTTYMERSFALGYRLRGGINPGGLVGN